MRRFIFGLDECSSALFFLVEGLALPSALDVESLPLVEDRFYLSVQYLEPIGLKPVNIAPPVPLTPLYGAFLPLFLTYSTFGGVWSPRLKAFPARLLEINL